MNKKFPLILILLLFLFSGLFAGVVSPHLAYTQSEKKIWNLTVADFQNVIIENEPLFLETGILSICFNFDRSIMMDISDTEIYINDEEIKDLNSLGKHYYAKNKYALNITQFLQDGRNKIEIYYYFKGGGEPEKHIWIINIGRSNTNPSQKPFPLTTDSEGWKRMFSISPDSRFIAYVFEAVNQNQNSIKLINLNTKKITDVIVSTKAKKQFGEISGEEKFYSYAPCWSRDSRHLFFISTKSGYFEIWRTEISYNGEVSNLTQLTNYMAYTSSLVISPRDGRLFFVSNKDGDLQLYCSSNPIDIYDKTKFMNSVERFSTDVATVFSPAISHGGNYIAYCKEKSQIKGSNVNIEIRSLSDKKLLNTIEIDNQDCLYPSWSPQKNIVSFYASNSIYAMDVLQNKIAQKVGTNCRLSSYATSPSWSDNAIYFVKNDNNSSINKIIIDYNHLDKSNTVSVLNDRDYIDNMEVGVTNNLKYIIYNSFKSGNWELWALPFQRDNSLRCVDFFLSPLSRISYFEPKNDKYKLIGYSPYLNPNKNVTFEKENIPLGFHKFKINKKPVNINNTSTRAPYNVTLPYHRSFPYFTKALRSAFLPGWGQKVSNNEKTGNFFFYSTIGLAVAGGSSYLLQENSFDKYNDSSTIKDIENNRVEYSSFSGLTNGIIIGGSLIYALNIFDALISKPDIPKPDRIRFSHVYREIKSDIPQKRKMYGQKNAGFGELKIFSTAPYTEIQLKSYEDQTKEITSYGKTGYTFDTDTYFTIKDIPPGKYELICKKPFMKTYKDNITIDEYKVNYSIVDMKSTAGLKATQFFYYSLPGCSQLKNQNYIKGGTILGLCAISLAGVLVNQAKATNDFNDYNNSTNMTNLIDSKADYSKHISMRNSFCSTLGLLFIYNLYDAYRGER